MSVRVLRCAGDAARGVVCHLVRAWQSIFTLEMRSAWQSIFTLGMRHSAVEMRQSRVMPHDGIPS
eukprot:1416791-Rhodomonas_salina.2